MNFIIYEDNGKFEQYYKKTIFELMCYSSLTYNVLSFRNDNLDNVFGNKIYLINVDSFNKGGTDFALKIRTSGDWMSPIIFISLTDERELFNCANLLILGYLFKKDMNGDKLLDLLRIALKINSCKKIFSFTMKKDLYQVPYEDILYIEKNLNDNSSVIVTKEKDYIIRKSIVNLEKEFLNEETFYKTHRSCIVNVMNIRKVNFEEGIISFNKCQIDLLSRANKKGLKNKLELLNHVI